MDQSKKRHLDKLADLLSTSAGRKSFANDPVSALGAADIEAKEIDQDLLDTLQEFSEAELDAIAKARDAFEKAKVDPEIVLKIV